jgi:hypothetical protein
VAAAAEQTLQLLRDKLLPREKEDCVTLLALKPACATQPPPHVTLLLVHPLHAAGLVSATMEPDTGSWYWSKIHTNLPSNATFFSVALSLSTFSS